MIILHVDDDADDGLILRDAILEADPTIEYIQATDGTQAQKLLLDKIPLKELKCIFLDIRMPVDNGIALLALIRLHEKFDNVPVYIYSNTRDESKIAQIVKLRGMFIQKGPNFKRLVQILKNIVN
jgi:CheY-like chemotaxis protein